MKLNKIKKFNHKRIVFHPYGGYPKIVSDVDGYYVELPYCKGCGNTVEKYEINTGILGEQGFYCEQCGSLLKSTRILKISKKKFCSYENNIYKITGVNNGI